MKPTGGGERDREPSGGRRLRRGEAVVAFVVPRAGAAVTGEGVIAHCRGKIAGYKIPKSVIVREKPLPLSGVGKVQNNVLRAELQR